MDSEIASHDLDLRRQASRIRVTSQGADLDAASGQ
jgi:hypothetical protein